MNDATDVFANAVIDSLAHSIFFTKRAISSPFVADNEGFLGKVGANDRKQLPAGSSFDMEAADSTATLDKGQDGVSIAARTSSLIN
jgi:hypothetical protein